jgi:pentatricopeptide repeat domain-containing protein 1
VKEADDLMTKMKENGCSPNECNNNTIIRGFLKNNDVQKAVEFVEEMCKSGFAADVSTTELVANLLTNDVLDLPNKELLKQFFQEPKGTSDV